MKDKAFTVVTKEVGKEDYKKGYNAITNQVVDMFKEKILDPTTVTINVVENAVSVSCEILTTDCVITNIRA
jgi:chaperonin GroEL